MSEHEKLVEEVAGVLANCDGSNGGDGYPSDWMTEARAVIDLIAKRTESVCANCESIHARVVEAEGLLNANEDSHKRAIARVAQLEAALGEITTEYERKRAWPNLFAQPAESGIGAMSETQLSDRLDELLAPPAPDPAESMRARCEAIAREWARTSGDGSCAQGSGEIIAEHIAALKDNGEGK